MKIDNNNLERCDTLFNEPMSDGTRCPHCGASYYTMGPSSTTCMYFQPIYKNGVNINPDRNWHTTKYHCLECGHDFEIKSNGEETVITDLGKRPEPEIVEGRDITITGTKNFSSGKPMVLTEDGWKVNDTIETNKSEDEDNLGLEVFKLNEDVLCKLSKLDKDKVYVFNIEVGDRPKEKVLDMLTHVKEEVDKTGITGIYVAAHNGISCFDIKQLSKYPEKK